MTFVMFIIDIVMMMEATVHMYGATLNNVVFLTCCHLLILFLNIVVVVYGQCVLTCGSSIFNYIISFTGAPKLPPFS